jgi:hypothetical protein
MRLAEDLRPRTSIQCTQAVLAAMRRGCCMINGMLRFRCLPKRDLQFFHLGGLGRVSLQTQKFITCSSRNTLGGDNQTSRISLPAAGNQIMAQRDATDPSPTKPFQLGLVLAGAISAGAYTSGVLDFLFQRWTSGRKRAGNRVSSTIA